jgi:hypothetical protein
MSDASDEIYAMDVKRGLMVSKLSIISGSLLWSKQEKSVFSFKVAILVLI